MGLSGTDLEAIARSIHFAHKHHKMNKNIVEAGDDASEGLLFVTSGSISIKTESDNGTYNLQEEKIAQNMIIEPHKLFGLHQQYSSTYITLSPCETINIPKSEIMKLMDKYLIVRINYLNMVCSISQKLERVPWRYTAEDTTSRIISFIKAHMSFPAGKKTFRIKMTQLAKEINVPRLEVSIALNKLEEDEKIILQRGMIIIPAPQLL